MKELTLLSDIIPLIVVLYLSSCASVPPAPNPQPSVTPSPAPMRVHTLTQDENGNCVCRVYDADQSTGPGEE